MGRMLDALKNLENDPGVTLAVPAPVAPPAAVPVPAGPAAEATPDAPANSSAPSRPAPPVTKPVAAGNSAGATLLATLAGSSASVVASQAAGPPAGPAPQSSTIASAAATLARLKASAPPVRTNASPLSVPVNPAATIATPPPAAASVVEPVVPALLPESPTLPNLTEDVARLSPQPPADAEIALPARRSSATRLEETIQAALTDPRRSVPLEQLARRMRTELRADAGRCWLLADAGEHHDSADLTAHLGAIFASQLGDVLLIDGSLDCALLSAGLNAIDRPGLAQVAAGGSKGWQSLIQPTSWEHLFLLPAGQIASGMPDPISAWTNLLSQAERRFRLVLVDGGPAADPTCKALGRICDATYLVIRLGVTEARQARQAMQQLRAGGARVIGSIATSVPSLETLR